MSLSVSEDELLQAYQLSSLYPQRWEDGAARQGDREAVEKTHAAIEEWSDPMGLRSTVPASRLTEPNQLDKISIGSKSFDPKTFLNTVHPNASFAELSQGAKQLKTSIEQRSEALKVLVDENFDRFVSVKATTDEVFRSMTDPDVGPLADRSDQGVQGLRTYVTDASVKADSVFRPVLENYVKSMKLRNTLGVFQRSRFFFNLPGSLQEYVEAGNYEAALRDYNKGKYLLESRPAQLLPIHSDGTNTDPPTEAQLEQQRRIFAGVWDGVEEVMYDMQSKLLGILREPHRSVDEQEKCIEVLLELDPTSDVVAVFLESQHEHIKQVLHSTYTREEQVFSSYREAEKDCSDLELAKNLYDCLYLVRTSPGAKPSFDKVLGAQTWQAADNLVEQLCQTALHTIPIFWRIARDHAEGKFGKDKAFSTSSIHAEAKAWGVQSIDLFTKSLTQFFGLESFRARSKKPLFSQLPAWVSATTCSLSATHAMSQILSTLSDTVRDLRNLAIPGTSTQLHALLLDTRFQFTEILCYLWLRDARLCHYLENWTPNTQQPAITSYLFAFSVFNRWNAREGFVLADVRIKNGSKNPEGEVDTAFVGRLKESFTQVLHTFLDGIVTAAQSPLDMPELQSLLRIPHEGRLPPPRDRDTRILLSASNLSHLHSHVIRAWVKQFEEAYQVSLGSEQQHLLDVCAQLDRELLGDSVRQKGKLVASIVRKGILEEGINWGQLGKPKGVNSFVYHALLSLVQVHAQIRATVPALVSRVIMALVEILADAILDAFSKVPTFNMGGMLQATLEIEFVHQTLAYHVSPKAEATLKHVYETISTKYSATAGKNDGSLQKELEGVKQTLVASRKATALEFLCFRRPKTDDARKVSKSSSKS